MVSCENGCNSLLRTSYKKKRIKKGNETGLWKYKDWLPVRENIDNLESHGPVTFNSNDLGEKIGLKNLFISFNGFWPERGIKLPTATFKDYEAQVTLRRILETDSSGDRLIIATEGNTGRAFAYYATKWDYPVLIVIREDMRKRKLWLPGITSSDSVQVLSIEEPFDYSDVILLAEEIQKLEGFFGEGGSANIARRDALGSVLLDATFTIGELPDHYFQALGSGPGAIAAYEASQRLVNDGRFGNKIPKIHGCQNYPFDPMAEAWTENSKKIKSKYQDEEAKDLIEETESEVLSNRSPTYSITGGVYDVLRKTNGEFYSIKNHEVRKFCRLFKETEGVDIMPAAGCAFASIKRALNEGKIDKDDNVLLNITGGGKEQISEKNNLNILKPNWKIDPNVKEKKEILDILQHAN